LLPSPTSRVPVLVAASLHVPKLQRIHRFPPCAGYASTTMLLRAAPCVMFLPVPHCPIRPRNCGDADGLLQPLGAAHVHADASASQLTSRLTLDIPELE